MLSVTGETEIEIIGTGIPEIVVVRSIVDVTGDNDLEIEIEIVICVGSETIIGMLRVESCTLVCVIVCVIVYGILVVVVIQEVKDE
jgi:hypothetical protein